MLEPLNFWEWIDEAEAREREDEGEPFTSTLPAPVDLFDGDDLPF